VGASVHGLVLEFAQGRWGGCGGIEAGADEVFDEYAGGIVGRRATTWGKKAWEWDLVGVFRAERKSATARAWLADVA